MKALAAARSCARVRGGMGLVVRVRAESGGYVGVGVVRKVLAAPMIGPCVGVVGDEAVGATTKVAVGAASNDKGLPSFAAADVGGG